LFVAIGKFTKWIEAKPITSIKAEKTLGFVTEIMHQFRVPNTIITNNGTQFTAVEFLDFCDEKGIKVNFASMAHP